MFSFFKKEFEETFNHPNKGIEIGMLLYVISGHISEQTGMKPKYPNNKYKYEVYFYIANYEKAMIKISSTNKRLIIKYEGPYANKVRAIVFDVCGRLCRKNP